MMISRTANKQKIYWEVKGYGLSPRSQISSPHFHWPFHPKTVLAIASCVWLKLRWWRELYHCLRSQGQSGVLKEHWRTSRGFGGRDESWWRGRRMKRKMNWQTSFHRRFSFTCCPAFFILFSLLCVRGRWMIWGEDECLWGGYRVFEVGLSKIKQVGNEKNNGVKNKRHFIHFWSASDTRIIIIRSHFTSSDHL